MPTAHENLIAAMTAPDAVGVRAYVANDLLWLSMAGQTFPLRPDGSATQGAAFADVYSTRHGTTPGVDGALTVADDGSVYATVQAFEAAAAPLCALADSGARAAIVAHLATVLASRVMV